LPALNAMIELRRLKFQSFIIPPFYFSIPSLFLHFVFLFLLALPLTVGLSAAAHGQTNPPTNPPSSSDSSVRCPSPANPHRLYRECAGRPFDFIEKTLTKDWGGFRAELSRLGITPTASYTAQLMGNPSGGQSRGFTYSGTMQASIFWDLDKLIRVPGLAFNMGAAWSTGKNLSADRIGNIFTVQSAYTAPGNGTNNLTLGELYLQQQLFNNSLIIAAGRLAPQSTFATMPVLNQYLNGGINPVPSHLSINDPTFAAYPPGVEWGLKQFTTSVRCFRWQPGCSTPTATPLVVLREDSTFPSSKATGARCRWFR
jgi:hypothetical protein